MSSDAMGPSRRDILATGAALTACAASGVISLLPAPARAAPPVWSTIPDQNWTVGVPVYLDLADYVTDPDGDPLGFSLDQALPPGLTLSGSVISGTPTAEADATYVAYADDTPDTTPPARPVNLRVF